MRCVIWSGRAPPRFVWWERARQHLQGFLLRHGRVYAGKKGWTVAYRRWLTTVRFTHPAQQIVLQDCIHAVTDAEARVERLTKQIAGALPGWSLAPVVEAVQAMRGVAFIVAVTVVPRSATSRGSPISAAADGLSRARRPRNIPAAHRSAAAASPRPAAVSRAGLWSRGPGATGCRLASAGSCTTASKPCRRPCATSPGRGNCG